MAAEIENLPKKFRLVAINKIDALPEAVGRTSKYFGMFLAMDATGVSTDAIGEVARRLIDRGLVYLCAWGPDCERVHDLFDETEVERGIQHPLPEIDVIMTTWHDKESLVEAAWFFAHSAWPSESYAAECRDWIAVVVADAQWEATLREEIAAGFPMQR